MSMDEALAVVGGEGNGGVIHPRLQHTRDAPAAAALILQHLLDEGATLSAAVRRWPAYAIVKEKVTFPRELLADAYRAVTDALEAGEADHSDGLRLAWPNRRAWLHVRPSGTEPVVRLIAEAGGAEYGRARKLMAEDANAAIRGAFEGGATDVLVNDSHGSQRNLLPEDLDPRARLISHSFKRYGMMEGLDESFDAVVFIGYHAKADAPRGLFAHTGSGVVRDLQVNGR